MLFPIYFIALAAALSLERDTFRDPTPPPDLPLPPPSPPPPPLPEARTLPRGINPALFRKNARQVAQELQSLFSRAYVLDHDALELRVQNPAAVDQLRRRLNQLREIAFHDPWAAREYDRSEIRRYFYFQNLEPRGAYFHLVNHDRPSEWVEEIFRDGASLDFDMASNPNEAENLFRRHPWISEGIFRIYPREIWAPFMARMMRQALENDPLIDDQSLKNQLTHAESRELAELWHYFSEHYEGGNSFRLEEPTAEAPDLLHQIWPFLEELDPFDRNQLMSRIVIFIPYFLAGRGMSAEEFYALTRLDPSERSRIHHQTRLLVTQRLLAIESSDPFDNASIRHRLLGEFEDYIERYSTLTPAQRANLDTIYRGGLIFLGLAGDDFGPPVTWREMERRQSERTHYASLYPPRRSVPYETPELNTTLAELGPQGVLEIHLEDFPAALQEIAKSIRPSSQPVGATLWDFLRENVSSVIFCPQLNSHELGTANPLTRTVFLETPDNERVTWWDTLTYLTHEAYHLYFAHSTVSRNPKLVDARLLDERNAYLFQAEVYRAYLQWRVDIGLSLQGGGHDLVQYAMRRITGLAANHFLGYPAGNDRLRYDIAPSIRSEDLNRYPTDLVDGYVQRTGAADLDALIDREVDQMLGILRRE